MATEIVSIKVAGGPEYWIVGVKCPICECTSSVPVTPDFKKFKIGCQTCDTILDVDITGMKPGDLKHAAKRV